MFTPSRDWGNEVWVSLWWIAQAWAYAAVGTMIVLFLIAKFTVWGRQFWYITGDYFKGRDSVLVWVWLALLLLSVIIGVRIDVLLTYYGNDMFTSFQVIATGVGMGDEAIKESGKAGFWLAMTVFAIVVTVYVIQIMLDILFMQRFMLRWRAWLTDNLTGDWLDGKAYYRARFIDDTIDNPDQRIQTDIDVFTAGVGPLPNTPGNSTGATLVFGAVSAVVSMVSFTSILWGLSGPLTLFGVTIPRALFWLGLAYVVFATIIAFWIGKPIIWLAFDNEKFNAAFRYALVRLRDASEAVAFYRGELAERAGLRQRFAPIVDNYKRYINRTVGFTAWNLSLSQIIVPLPYILQFPRFYAGDIKLGDMSQSSQAFSSIQNGLSFFRNAYDHFAGYRAAIIRLHGLKVANREGRELPSISTTACVDGTVELSKVEVRTPVGDQLVDPLDLRLEVGDTLVVTGKSGSGKTTLLRSLAELWPFTTGTLTRPCGPNETMFLSQMPYVPLGDLRAVVTYPCEEGSLTDDELKAVLEKVALPHLGARLDEVQDWAKVLSPGEQQRIAFARILLTKPKAAFLDESTSALDEGLEMLLYRLVREDLPNTILVSVSHRKTVEQHHTKELRLLGGGPWQLVDTRDEQAGDVPVS